MKPLSIFFMYMLIFLCSLWSCSEAKSPEEWKSRIIYQLLTDRFAKSDTTPANPCTDLRSYCGGTFNGIKQNLDYIQGLGANAIWISPIPENTPLGYHGFWAKNIYEVNPMFGTKEELHQLIEECHRRDIWVMLDVVANHMGYNHDCFWSHECSLEALTNFTGYTPFDSTEHYHTLCEINSFRNQTEVELCRLAKLPDLNQTNTYVNATLLRWISDMQKNYSFDGFRIDTVVEVSKEFWAGFQIAAGAYCVGEANNGENVTYLAEYQGPLDAVLNFPLYWALRKVFNEQKSMQTLKYSLNEQRSAFLDVTTLGTFIDNHDFPRFLSLTNDTTIMKNALTYIMLAEGIPIIYYGTEQKFTGNYDPNNRESLWPYYNPDEDIYQFIAALAKLRRQPDLDFSSRNQEELFVNDRHMAFTRGKKHEIICLVTNTFQQSNETIAIPVQKIYTDGTILRNVLMTSDTIEVKQGLLKITVQESQPLVYRIDGSPNSGQTFSPERRTSLLYTLLIYFLAKEVFSE